MCGLQMRNGMLIAVSATITDRGRAFFNVNGYAETALTAAE